MKTHILTLLFMLSPAMACFAQVTKLEPIEYSKKLSVQPVLLIDIRTPQEFANGHIQGAINVDYYSATFAADIDKYAKNKPLYIYCRSGNRTSLATNQLVKLGYTQIFDLKSGIAGWQSADLPLVK